MDLIEKLIKEGVLDEEKAFLVEKEAEKSGKTREEVILNKNLVGEEDLFTLKSEIVGVPLKKNIKPEEVPEDLLGIIPEDSVNHYKIIPIGREDEEVEIGMVYPENLRAKEALKFILRKENFSYKISLIPLSVFEKIALRFNSPIEKIKSPLVERLVKENFFEKEEAFSLEKEAEEKKKSVEELLLEKEKISEEELFEIKSNATGFPLKNDVNLDDISLEVLNLIHEDSVNYYKMIPVGKIDEEVQIGMVYPESLKAQEALKFISRKNIFSHKVFLIPFSVFEKIKQKYHGLDEGFEKIFMNRLMERGVLNQEQVSFVESEAERENKTREEILLKQNLIPENEIFSLKSEITTVPLKEKINFDELGEDLFRIIPEEAIDYYKMIPVGKIDEEVEIGMVYPENLRAQEAVKIIFSQRGLPYKVYLISLTEFKEAYKKLKAFTRETGSTLTEKLVKEGFIEKEKVEEFEQEVEGSEKTKEELLVEKKIIPEEKLFSLKSETLGVDLKADFDIKKIQEEVLRVIPEDSANYYKMAPIGKTDEEVEIGMVYPEDLRAKEALKFLSRRDGFSYKVYLITLSNFREISKQYRTLTKEVGEALEDVDIDIEEDEGAIDMDQDIGRLAEEAPIVKVVAVVLKNAIEGGASDIHIEPSREKLKVRFRVDGILYSSLYLPMAIHLATIARIKILAGLKIDEQRLPQDGRFSTRKSGKSVDFRVSTFPTTIGEKVVIRVLDPSEGLKSLDKLGIKGINLQKLKTSIKKPTGMTLITGPTGSGKSTTLYAVMDNLDRERLNIVTLEDPVEYFMDGINQSQVHPEIGYVFSKGLRQILRQDPDVIMVGEIRDDETAELAIHAALTGHMVLSTLHTNSAIGAIPRLIDMGIKPFLIPPAINALVSQRLVRGLCEKCKEQITPTEEIKALIMNEIKDISPSILKELNIPSPLKIYTAKGCSSCSEEGLVGRLAINEILKMTENLGEATMKNPTEKELNEEARKQDMVTLKQDGVIKVIQGYTTIEEVLRATEEK